MQQIQFPASVRSSVRLFLTRSTSRSDVDRQGVTAAIRGGRCVEVVRLFARLSELDTFSAKYVR